MFEVTFVKVLAEYIGVLKNVDRAMPLSIHAHREG